MTHVAPVLDGLKITDLMDSPAVPARSPLGTVLRTQVGAGGSTGFSSHVSDDVEGSGFSSYASDDSASGFSSYVSDYSASGFSSYVSDVAPSGFSSHVEADPQR
ncbi:hypothetical protein [Yinghuangia sp. YIM S09857]|uniref:hypothetical protein n=1 Tax=Yinghuangia sp. YIM S09857 TaxID=3436929 RepID=UPI003F52B73E